MAKAVHYGDLDLRIWDQGRDSVTRTFLTILQIKKQRAQSTTKERHHSKARLQEPTFAS